MKDQANNIEFKQRVVRIIRYLVILLFVFLIGGMTPYSDIFLGLALGTSVSMINLIVTAKKVNQIGEVASNSSNNNTKPLFSGMITRFALSILAVLIALEYPQYFNIISVILGLVIAQFIAIVDGIKHS